MVMCVSVADLGIGTAGTLEYDSSEHIYKHSYKYSCICQINAQIQFCFAAANNPYFSEISIFICFM